MSGKKEGTGGGHRVKEASQVTIIGSPEVGSGQLSRKKTPGYTLMWSEWIEERGDNKEPGEGGAVSKAWMGEPSARKANEVRKVASSRLCACRGEKEGSIRSMECSKRGNVDQRQ